MKSGKRHITDGMELPNQEKVRTLAENETYKYLDIIEADNIKEGEMKDKIFKNISQENEKTTRDNTLLLKPNQRKKIPKLYPSLDIWDPFSSGPEMNLNKWNKKRRKLSETILATRWTAEWQLLRNKNGKKNKSMGVLYDW